MSNPSQVSQDGDPARGSQLKHKVSPDEHTLAQTKSWKSGEREILKEKEERFGN